MRLQFQQQLDTASQKGEISSESRNEINQWVCIQINSVNSDATEEKFKDDFAAKMNAAKDALVASKKNAEATRVANSSAQAEQPANQTSTATSQQQTSDCLSAEEESTFRKECQDMINDAVSHKEYHLDRGALQSIVSGTIDQEKGKLSRSTAERCRRSLTGWIDGAKQNAQHEERDRQKIVRRNTEQANNALKGCDELVAKYEKALKDHDEKVNPLLSSLPAEFGGKDRYRETLTDDIVETYKKNKKDGKYLSDSQMLDRHKQQLEAAVENAQTRSKKIIDRYNDIISQYGRTAEADWRRAVDNSSDLYNEAARKQKLSDATKLKASMSAPEYTAKLIEMTKTLNDEVQAHREKEAAVRSRVHSLKNKKTTDWIAAVHSEKDSGSQKELLKALLAAKGFTDSKDYTRGISALVKEYLTQDELVSAVRNEGDHTEFWMAASQFVDDQSKLRNLLIDDDKWIRNSKRERVSVVDQERVYYAMVRNVTDQEVLMKLLENEEINFESSGVDSYGKRNQVVLGLLDAAHLNGLDRNREERRTAIKGQTIEFKGFYLGMSMLDKDVLQHTAAKDAGKIGGVYGIFGQGPMSSLWFSAAARHKYLGVKKDGLVGLGELVNKYVPGGLKSTGDVQIGAKADAGYDPENPEITVTTWWYVNVPQFKCCIRMYDSGSVKIYTTDEDDKVILDFSKAKKIR